MIANVIPFFAFILYFYLVSLLDSLPISVPNKSLRKIYLLSFIILVIFAGCRWSSWRAGIEAGIFDYDTYKTIFEYPLSLSSFVSDYMSADVEIKQVEIGYLFYSTFWHTIIGNQYNLYLLITNLILISLLYKSFKLNGIKAGLFFIIFFYASRLYLQYNFIILRQAIAMMLVWCSFPYVLRKEWVRFYLVVLVAFSFHFSAIIACFTPVLLYIKINKTLFFSLFLLLFILNITGLYTQIFLTGIESFFSKFGADGIGRLVKYVAIYEDSSQSLNLLTFIEAIPFGYIAIVHEKRIKKSIDGVFFYNMFFLFLLLLVLTMNFSFLTRICQYFIYSYVFLLHFYYCNVADRNRFVLLSSVGAYLFVYACRYNMIWFYTTPYSFCLFNVDWL